MRFTELALFLSLSIIGAIGCSGSGPTGPGDGGGGGGGDGGGGGGNGGDGHAPEITSLSFPSGHTGDIIDILGSRFGDRQDNGYVLVGDDQPYILNWSDIQIAFSVPPYPGAKGVKVSQNKLLSNEFPFFILNDDISYQSPQSTNVTPSDMAPPETYGPFAAVSLSGKIFVAWCGYINHGIFLAVSDDDGKSFDTPVRIDTGNQQFDSIADSVAIAANDNGIIAIAWRDFRLPLPNNGEIYLSISDDKSDTFTEIGMVSSSSIDSVKGLPDVTIEPSGGVIKIFWREFKDIQPEIMIRKYDIALEKFDDEDSVINSAALGSNPYPTVLCSNNNVDYVLWINAGVYMINNASGTAFSSPTRIDLSPAYEYIKGKTDVLISNGHLVFTYADPRYAQPPLSPTSMRDIFLADFNISSGITEKEIRLTMGQDTDFYNVSIASSSNGSIYSAMLGSKLDGITFDTIILAREYRKGILRDEWKISEFDETYKLGGTAIVLDSFNRPIVLWDVREFSEGAEIYIALPE